MQLSTFSFLWYIIKKIENFKYVYNIQAIADNTIQQFRAETTCYHTNSYEIAKQAQADTTKRTTQR